MIIKCKRCGEPFPKRLKNGDIAEVATAHRAFTFTLSGGEIIKNRTIKPGGWLFKKEFYCPLCWRIRNSVPVKRGKYCRKSYLISRLPAGTSVEDNVIYTDHYENKYVKLLFLEYNFMVQKSLFHV